MSNRTTIKTLETLVQWINEKTNQPLEPWTRTDKKFTANIGNYHLDGAYGGYALYQMTNEGGEVHDVSRIGHVPKKELERFLRAFLAGLDTQ